VQKGSIVKVAMVTSSKITSGVTVVVVAMKVC